MRFFKKRTNRTVVTRGGWDLLHVGHVRFLNECRKLGDLLIVGVFSDQMFLQEKKRHPVVPGHLRAEMVLSLKSVSSVEFVLDNDEYFSELLTFPPSVFVLSEEHKDDPKYKYVLELMAGKGTEIVALSYDNEISSTAIIAKIKADKCRKTNTTKH